MPLIAGLLGSLVAASSALAQTMPVPMNGSFGPGRIDAGLAGKYVDQQVSACGRVVNVGRNFMLIGSNLWVFTPASVEPQTYSGTVICASGTVYLRDGGNGIQVPSIDVHSPAQIAQIGPTGPYTPPSRCRPCERQQPDGTCRQVRACY